MLTESRRSTRRHWMRHLGRALAILTQLVLLLAPIAEGREEHLLDPHVEAPRTTAHPGHRPVSCAECVLLSLHGRAEERAELLEPGRIQGACRVATAIRASGVEREPSNSSRAPPVCV